MNLRAMHIEVEEMLPCVGQAAIGIEVKENHPRLASVLAVLDDRETHLCVNAERSFLAAMGGGCQLAVAAYAQVFADRMRLRGISFLGDKPARGEVTGLLTEASSLGRQLAAQVNY